MTSFRFDSVDKNEPEKCIAFLDVARSLEKTQRDKQRTYEMLSPSLGQRILDVGCGTGEDACALAGMVGDSGRVIGVDASQSMIKVARQRATSQQLRVAFHRSNVNALPFQDNYFHSCRAERLLHFLDSPESALREMTRVTMPLGRVLVAEPDWDSLEVSGVDDQLSAKILDANKGGSLSSRSVASRLSDLFENVGLAVDLVELSHLEVTELEACKTFFNLENYAISAVKNDRISVAAAKAWLLQLEHAAQQGQLCCALTSYVVVGTKLSN